MASPEQLNILLAVAFLAVKHTIADYVLQSTYQHKNKGRYGHPGGLIHAGIHVALTPPLFWIFPPTSASLAALLLVGEFVIHYHLDWIKKNLVTARRWSENHKGYWIAFGTDQLAHTLTYLGMIYILIQL